MKRLLIPATDLSEIPDENISPPSPRGEKGWGEGERSHHF
jgi:hypothetical protein